MSISSTFSLLLHDKSNLTFELSGDPFVSLVHSEFNPILRGLLGVVLSLERSVFRFQFEKFERRTDSNFE